VAAGVALLLFAASINCSVQSPVASEGAVESIFSQESLVAVEWSRGCGEADVSLFWQLTERTLLTSVFWMK